MSTGARLAVRVVTVAVLFGNGDGGSGEGKAKDVQMYGDWLRMAGLRQPFPHDGYTTPRAHLRPHPLLTPWILAYQLSLAFDPLEE